MPFNENHPNYSMFLTTIAEHRAPVVFWIGAGVSADAGLPNWPNLRKTLAAGALEELVALPKSEADILEPQLQQATNTGDLWSAFEVLKEILGEPTYKSIIRSQLGQSDIVSIPELHELIWRLEATRGVISLNIDGLEGRAHRHNRKAENVTTFVGRDLKNQLHTLRDKKPFIARLHGHHSDRTSWVFTKTELSQQVQAEAYRMALQSIFSNFTVVFLGISAEDVAAGGFLADMTAAGIDAGNHFWITNRNEATIRNWANEAGLLRVQYSVAENESHTSVIRLLLERAQKHISKDPIPTPVIYSGDVNYTIPSVDQLRTMQEDDVRLALNAYAKNLLEANAQRTDTTSYQEFLATFSPAIHQSSHLDTQQGYNKFFGYTAVERIHSGPFSSVWRVQDNDYKQFALKIMQLDNLRKGPQLDSFRRGIASQKLIRDTGQFSAIAEIKSAFEIPPSVIMEFVEGENLEEVSQKSTFDFWNDGLKVLINLCRELQKAHKSKFGILHRDIKPTNIMIPNYYYMETAVDHGLDQHEIKILNYDMTWHTDATGRVVPINQASAGYYAPELMEEPDSDRARDSRVDSYGVGMTIFRLASGKLPPSSGSNSNEWQSYLTAVRKAQHGRFNCAHGYLQRIIDEATQPEPANRIYVGDILAKLKVLQSAMQLDMQSWNIEILAENLMYAICGDAYEASARGTTFKRNLDGYRNYQIDARQSPDVINLLFSNSQSTGADWSKIDKSWSQKLATAREILKSGGWTTSNANNSYGQRVLNLSASITQKDLVDDYDRAEGVLKRAIQKVQID